MAASAKQVTQAKQMAAAGKSAGQIEKKTGVSENRAASLVAKASTPSKSPSVANDRGPVGNTAPKSTPITQPTIQQLASGGGNSNSVRDQIKDAGSNGNISKNELMKISDSTGKSTDQIIRQLDKVNANSADNNKAPIGLGNAAFNSLLNTPTSKTIMGQTMTALGLGDKYNNYGSGGIGQAIMQGKGTSDYYGNSTPGTGKIPQGQQVFGSYNGVPQLQIKPQNNVNAGYYGAGTGTGGTKVFSDPVVKDPVVQDPVVQDPIAPIIPEEEPVDPGQGMMAGGGRGADGAAKLGRARSRLQRLGIYGRGTGLLGRGLQYGNSLNA
jgi:hypothetical protein